MLQLNSFQTRILRKLANSSCKIFLCPADDPLDISDEFNDILRLIDTKMVIDVTDRPEYVKVLKDWEWCDLVIVNLTNRGQRLFERVSWEKWVN